MFDRNSRLSSCPNGKNGKSASEVSLIHWSAIAHRPYDSSLRGNFRQNLAFCRLQVQDEIRRSSPKPAISGNLKDDNYVDLLAVIVPDLFVKRRFLISFRDTPNSNDESRYSHTCRMTMSYESRKHCVSASHGSCALGAVNTPTALTSA